MKTYPNPFVSGFVGSILLGGGFLWFGTTSFLAGSPKLADGGQVLLMLLTVPVVFVYFLPALVAESRHKRNAEAIFALNLLAGWTTAGWIIAFVWALTRDE